MAHLVDTVWQVGSGRVRLVCTLLFFVFSSSILSLCANFAKARSTISRAALFISSRTTILVVSSTWVWAGFGAMS